MKISVTGVMVDDQAKALSFYVDILGFVKKQDIPIGEHRWLTVVSKDDKNGTELLLEPMGFEPAKVYQKAVYEAGMPYTMFEVDNLEEEYERLVALEVTFTQEPTIMGDVMIAILDDTCGNNIQLVQLLKK